MRFQAAGHGYPPSEPTALEVRGGLAPVTGAAVDQTSAVLEPAKGRGPIDPRRRTVPGKVAENQAGRRLAALRTADAARHRADLALKKAAAAVEGARRLRKVNKPSPDATLTNGLGG